MIYKRNYGKYSLIIIVYIPEVNVYKQRRKKVLQSCDFFSLFFRVVIIVVSIYDTCIYVYR